MPVCSAGSDTHPPQTIGDRTGDAYQAWYHRLVWTVVDLPEAERERGRLSARERSTLYNAVAKLQAIGPSLGYPHSSAVRGTDRLRGLRPRAGRSPIRRL